MRLLNRQVTWLVWLVACVPFLTMLSPGAAYTSKTSNSSTYIDKPSKASTSTRASASTTTSTGKKAKSGASTETGVMEKTALATGSVLSSAVYTPAKALYAAGGTLTGSMVYLMSAGQSTTAASNIITRSTCGDWFVRPSHLSGDRNLRFDATPVVTKRGKRKP